MARCIPPSEQHSTKRRTTSSAIISVILAFVMLIQVSAESVISVKAAVTDSVSEIVAEQTQTNDSTEDLYGGSVDINNLSNEQIVGELNDMRDESTKYFRLSDGTIAAAIYDSPVHTLDADQTWQEIDYSLSDDGTDYANSSGSMRVKFSKNVKNGKLYTLKTDDGDIKWSLLGVKESNKAAKLSQKENKTSKLETNSISGAVTYEDILPGVTLQYWITENKLKENIIFADADSAGPLTFELQTNKFELTLSDNVINFVNSEGETVFAMSAPWMMDNDGIHSEDITLSLSGSKNHYEVTITPNAQWLKNAA